MYTWNEEKQCYESNRPKRQRQTRTEETWAGVCDVCEVERRGRGNFHKHHIKCHTVVTPLRRLSANAAQFHCCDCGKAYGIKKHLERHHISAHQPEAPAVDCEECGATLKNRFSLEVHTRITHRQRKPRLIFCADCGKRHFRSISLLEHYVLKHLHVNPEPLQQKNSKTRRQKRTSKKVKSETTKANQYDGDYKAHIILAAEFEDEGECNDVKVKVENLLTDGIDDEPFLAITETNAKC